MMKSFLRHRRVMCLCFFLLSPYLFPVEVSIPRLELMSWGNLKQNSFELSSRGYVGILFHGSERDFGGKVEFLFQDTDLESQGGLPASYDSQMVEQALQKYLSLNLLMVEMKRVFNLPLSLAYFTGSVDTLGSGEVFPSVFGGPAIATPVQGYLYFPTGVQYDGLHSIKGTGLKLHSDKASERLHLAFYSYQDQYLGKGKYSSDFWIALNYDALHVETFVGASYPTGTYGVYRAGLLFHYLTPEGSEFFTQIGVPRWDPHTDKTFTVDLFYFLFEPRVQIGLFGVSLTFFWHPAYYLQTPTQESGVTDLFLRFTYGKQPRTNWAGGIEQRVTFQTNAGEQIVYRITPYFSILTRGVQWEFRVNLNIYPFDVNSLFQTFLGARTSF